VHDAEVPEHLFRRLVGAYLGGAQQMVVREDPTLRPATRAVIRTFCRRTDRMEIERDDGASIVLQDQDEDGEALLGPRLRRMGEMVRAFHREAVGSWSRLPMGEESSWNHDDDALDREAWWLERHAALRLRDRPGETEALGAWTVARSLERIADHAVVLGEAGGRLASLHYDRRTLTTLEQFHRQAMEHLEGVLAATDDAGANDLLDMGEALMASGRALADRLLPAVNDGSMPPATAAAVTRILESITRTVAYAQDIAQVVLDRSVAVGPPRLAAPLLTAP
jgi:phosphate uptake regulator